MIKEYKEEYLSPVAVIEDQTPGLSIDKLDANISVRGLNNGSTLDYFTGTTSFFATSGLSVIVDLATSSTNNVNLLSLGNKITVQKDGLYQITISSAIFTNSIGTRTIELFKNGLRYDFNRFNPNTTSYTILTLSVGLYLLQGDELIVKVFQNSGSDLSSNAAANKFAFIQIQ